MMRAEVLTHDGLAMIDVDPVQSPDPKSDARPSGSRLIERVLPLAMRFWLQSQVDQVTDLTFQIEGTDRQILSGYVPRVRVGAQQAVYQGVHIHQAELCAEAVRVNLGQVLRGKSLRLLQAFSVVGMAQLTEAGLNASLQSDLLALGLKRFWQTLLTMPTVEAELNAVYGGAPEVLEGCQPRVRLCDRSLSFSWLPPAANQVALTLQAGLGVEAERFLVLRQPQWLPTPDAGAGQPSLALAGFQWDLGSEACLQQLILETGRLRCQGRVLVKP
jgi:hypothetical protein